MPTTPELIDILSDRLGEVTSQPSAAGLNFGPVRVALANLREHVKVVKAKPPVTGKHEKPE